MTTRIEVTKKYATAYLAASKLAALGTVIGLVLPFDQMVNIVYVINGYAGILLLALMITKTVTRTARRQAP